jgi:hypothetical protein
VPSEVETVVSQLARTVWGPGPMYYAVIGGTTVILIMAANTAFAGSPWLSAILANDGYLPRQLAFRGSRLVYSRGIVVLAALAAGLIIAFDASVSALIPLYAIGVFLSFTLSQAGMAHRWYKSGKLAPGTEIRERGSTLQYTRGWRTKMLINGFGAVCTAVVMMVFAITKFSHGAWVVLLLIPFLVALFSAIHRHYRELARQLSLANQASPPRLTRHRVILSLAGVHKGSLEALRYARLLSSDVTAVHVSFDETEDQALRDKWDVYGEGVRLVILHSPYRVLLKPLVQYIDQLAETRQPNEVITVIVPQFVPSKWWHHLLHTQAAMWLRLVLLTRPGIQVTDVSYLVR